MQVQQQWSHPETVDHGGANAVGHLLVDATDKAIDGLLHLGANGRVVGRLDKEEEEVREQLGCEEQLQVANLDVDHGGRFRAKRCRLEGDRDQVSGLGTVGQRTMRDAAVQLAARRRHVKHLEQMNGRAYADCTRPRPVA